MARNDIKIVDTAGLNVVPSREWLAEAAATAMLAGEPVKAKTAGSKYAIPLADAEPVIGTTTAVLGIAASDSTATASADGKLSVYLPLPGVTFSAKAKTASAADTQAEIDALVGKRVLLDLTGSTYTVDTAAADNAANDILIVGGDFATSSIYFQFRGSGTILN